MRGIILFWLLLFSICSGQAQVVIGGESTEVKNTPESPKDTVTKKMDGSTSVYFISNWSRTDRVLESNGDIYGDPLGKRADETSLDTWSFGIGLRNKINDHFYWDGGISYSRNGESYMFKETDTSYSYQTTYSYIGMPLRINYTVGKEIQWYVGAGLIPQMFTKYKRETQWTTSGNATFEETFKTKSGYNPFVISAVFNTGILLNMNNGWSLVLSPEIKIQLNSSYPELDGYVHKARAYGITFGLIRNL